MATIENLDVLERRVKSDNESERWAAAAELAEYVYNEPDRVWPIVLRLASSDTEDVRQAIATNVLEHLLERHFKRFFPLLETEIKRGNENLRDSLRLCWKFGQSLDAPNSKRWDSLVSRDK